MMEHLAEAHAQLLSTIDGEFHQVPIPDLPNVGRLAAKVALYGDQELRASWADTQNAHVALTREEMNRQPGYLSQEVVTKVFDTIRATQALLRARVQVVDL
jgi:hypothetical protein